MPNWCPTPATMPMEATALKSLGQVRMCASQDAGSNTGLWWMEVYAYNATGGALTANGCYVLSYDGDEENNPKVIVAAATATVQRFLCVATAATATADYGWVVVEGYYSVRCDGTTDIAKDDFLKLAPGTDADALIKDGTAETISSVAIAREAFATDANGNVLCYILGARKIINT